MPAATMSLAEAYSGQPVWFDRRAHALVTDSMLRKKLATGLRLPCHIYKEGSQRTARLQVRSTGVSSRARLSFPRGGARLTLPRSASGGIL